jgi:dTDP-glucose 4,6-dehydratase
LLHGKPITVFKGHRRTSTYVYDTVNTLANISENFNAGRTYNIASDTLHTIEELSDLVLKYTGANENLVSHTESEILTTKDKFVDVSKAKKELNHKNTTELEEGIKRTVEWMVGYYNI